MSTEARKTRTPKAHWRVLTEVLVIGIFVFGLFFQTGTGSASAMGPLSVFYLCPVGALAAFLASRTLIPIQLIGFMIFVAFTLLLGRAFCAWICPTQLWYKILNRLDNGARKQKDASKKISSAHEDKAAPAKPGPEELPKFLRIFGSEDPRFMGGVHDSRNWVLVAVLVAAFFVAFPLFCIICPVGLTFATLVSLFNFIRFDTFGPGVIVFPLLLLIEILVIPRWCHTLCPISAAISWISRGNKTFVPEVDTDTCLITTGKHCPEYCKTICVERIDLHREEESAPLHQCTKCQLCADACPVSAISFPFMPRKGGQDRVDREHGGQQVHCSSECRQRDTVDDEAGKVIDSQSATSGEKPFSQ